MRRVESRRRFCLPKGPVIGPLVIGCAVFDPKGRKELKKLNVRDSKKVAPSRRILLEPKIKEISLEWNLALVYPSEIDRLRRKISLNVIEAMKIAELIRSLKNLPDRIIVDSADTVPENYKKRIIEFLNLEKIPEIISEHRADDNYVEVSAASILAKVERDRIIEGMKEKYGEIGSGYPADELTQKFLKDLRSRGEVPDFIRRSWNTFNKSKQTRLGEFD